MNKFSEAVVTGFGYTGSRLCAKLRQHGCDVTALVRNDKATEELSALGCRRFLWDLDDDASQDIQWMSGTVLFHLVPPPPHGIVDTRLRRLLTQLAASPPAALILASTSGVYGDRQGEWVTESDPVNPATDRARRRVDAELAAKDFCAQQPTRLAILRIAGIYGPDRLPIEKLRAATPLPPSHEIGFSNRIHVDDLVTVLVAAANYAGHGEIFNVADGTPSSTREWFEQIAKAADLAPPPIVELARAEGKISPMFLSFLRESRRLDTRRLQQKLNIELAFVDPVEGIRAALAASTEQ